MSYPPSAAYFCHTSKVEQLSPHFIRITFQSEEFKHFGLGRLDQRIKLLLPLPDGSLPLESLFAEPRPTMSDWYQQWRLLPDELRNPLRTYTVREINPDTKQLVVDFVVHGTEGPASAWALQAKVGDPLVIIGPDARSETTGGIEWRPGLAKRVLLAGDETAAPAIAAILESLDPEIEGVAFIEIPASGDELKINNRSKVKLSWLARDQNPHGSLLSAAVKTWASTELKAVDPGEEPPPNEFMWDVPQESPNQGEDYAWLAGEAGVIAELRRYLVRDCGVDRSRIAFMGYWKIGKSEN